MFSKFMESTLITTTKGLDMVAYATMTVVGKDKLGHHQAAPLERERTMVDINNALIEANKAQEALNGQKILLLREKMALAQKEVDRLAAKHQAIMSELEGLGGR